MLVKSLLELWQSLIRERRCTPEDRERLLRCCANAAPGPVRAAGVGVRAGGCAGCQYVWEYPAPNSPPSLAQILKLFMFFCPGALVIMQLQTEERSRSLLVRSSFIRGPLDESRSFAKKRSRSSIKVWVCPISQCCAVCNCFFLDLFCLF